MIMNESPVCLKCGTPMLWARGCGTPESHWSCPLPLEMCRIQELKREVVKTNESYARLSTKLIALQEERDSLKGELGEFRDELSVLSTQLTEVDRVLSNLPRREVGIMDAPSYSAWESARAREAEREKRERRGRLNMSKPRLSQLEMGLICAAAFIADAHGADTYSRDILVQHGIRNCAGADSYDFERLLKADIIDKTGKVR